MKLAPNLTEPKSTQDRETSVPREKGRVEKGVLNQGITLAIYNEQSIIIHHSNNLSVQIFLGKVRRTWSFIVNLTVVHF